MGRTDGELLRAFYTANDQAAFEELLQRHAVLVFNVCNRILADRQDAEDASQAVFLTLARKASTLQSRATISTWLYQVAWHVAMRARSASRARARLEVEAVRMKEQLKPDASALETVKGVLDQELNALPLQYLQPIILHHLEGRSEEEGARLMGLKLGTFSARLNRAREALRTRLAQRGLAFGSVTLLQEALSHGVNYPTSPTWLVATTKAALLAKAGDVAAAPVISHHTLQMMHGALKMLAVKQMKTAAGVSACMLLAAAFCGLFYHWYASQQRFGANGTNPPVLTGGSEQTPTAMLLTTGFVRVLGSATFQPAGYVEHVAFSADEKYIAAAGAESISIWEIATATEVVRSTLQSAVWDVRFLKDNSLLILPDAVGFEPRSFLKWDWRKELKPHALQVPPSEKKFPYNQFLSGRFMTVFADGNTALAPGGSPNGSMLKAVDLKTGAAIAGIDNVSRSAKDVEYVVHAIGASNDGTLVACVDVAGGWTGADNHADQNKPRFSIWDWKTKELLHEWTKTATYVEGITWMPDGKHLFVSGMGEWNSLSARILNASDGAEIRSFPGHGVLSTDGSNVTTFLDGKVRSYSSQDGREMSSFEATGIKFPMGAVLSPNGTYFAVTSNGASFLLVDLKKKQQLAPGLDAHLNPPYCMTFAADGRLFLYDGALSYVYNEEGKRVLKFPSKMYRTGANSILNEGRILIAHGSGNGQAEMWDTYTGMLLGHLGATGNAVEGIHVSADDRWALLGYEYNGTVRFFDLVHGVAQADLHGPTHTFFGSSQNVSHCIWTADGKKAFLADTAARVFDKEELKKLNLTPPIGLSGAFDPSSGARLFWFKDAANNPLQCVQELDLNPAGDQLFVLDLPRDGKITTALVNASDGTFIRDVKSPGYGARFSADGKLLVGVDALVDVQSGAVIRKFNTAGTRLISSSRTQLAQLNSETITIWDVRTGLMVWQCRLDPKLINSPHLVVWNFTETQLAISPKEGSAVFQLELYANVPVASKVDVTDTDALRRAISDVDVDNRQAAVLACVEKADVSMPVLMKIIGTPVLNAEKLANSEMLQCRMAIVALERIAREKNKLNDIVAFFTKQSTTLNENGADLCRDALLRLNAVVRAQELRQKVARPAALKWPLNENVGAEKSGDF